MPKVYFTTWDDYVIMSNGRKRIWHVAKELDVPAFRDIGIALRDTKTASLAVKRFPEYLKYR